MAEKQNNCFTDIRDGIEALYRIIENAGNRCDGEIINIGNPENEASIEELGEMLLASFEKHPLRHYFPPFAGFRVVESSSYYGKGYQDVEHRKPSIRNARRCPTGNRKLICRKPSTKRWISSCAPLILRINHHDQSRLTH